MKAIASTAVSLVMLSSVASTKLVSNNAVQLASSQPKPAVAAQVEPQAPSQDVPATPAPVLVTVQAGDSLSSIADANGTTYVRIFDANDSLTDPNVINPGQQLRIPTADEQLPDRLPAATAAAASSTSASTPAAARKTGYSTASYPVSDDAAKAFIYAHESGNNPNATSPRGCYGLGQDCNGRVQSQCGADYACQDEYFTSYAMGRYGSWANAEAFWQANGWW